MTDPKHTDTSRSGDLVERRYLLVKRGLYYAPDNCGYTGIKDRAGRYFASDAGNETVAIHEDEAPAFSSACWEDVKVRHLSDRIEALEAENARLREALETIVNNCGQCGGYGTYPEEEITTGKVLWSDCSSPQCQEARAALKEIEGD